jgi:hypothetical protein
MRRLLADESIVNWFQKKLLSREGSDFASLLCVVNNNYQAYAR